MREWTPTIATCRYCHGCIYEPEGRVIYGVRHSAHAECYVKRHGWARLLSITTAYSAYNVGRYAARRTRSGRPFEPAQDRA